MLRPHLLCMVVLLSIIPLLDFAMFLDVLIYPLELLSSIQFGRFVSHQRNEPQMVYDGYYSMIECSRLLRLFSSGKYKILEIQQARRVSYKSRITDL
jgi:hypothetical protein